MIKARTLQDLFKRYRRPGDLVFSVLCVVFSIFLVLSLPEQTVWSSRGKLFAQSAFWPYTACYMMLVFSFLHLLSSLLSPALPGRWQEVGFWLRSVEFAGWFLIYVIVVPQLGYLLSTIAFVLALSLRMGYRKASTLAAAVMFAIIVVLIFKTFLQVKVPGGAIYELLPTALRSFMLTYF